MTYHSILERGCERDWETVDADAVEPVRFAVIGLGWFTRGRALPALVSSDRCVPTVAVSSTEAKAARAVAETDELEHALTYEAFHDGVATDAYDAIYICTPNALHLEYAQTAATHGKAVLCEKPLERDSERARRLVDTCVDAGVQLMTGYRMHTEPAVRRAKALLDAGLIGEPVAVSGSMSQRLLERVNPDPTQWRLDAELAGGGALFDLGIYPLNTARFLLERDPVAVSGRTRQHHDAFDDVDETTSFSLEFPGEVIAQCVVSHNARQSSAIRVTGTEGRVELSPAFFQDRERVLQFSRGDCRTSITFDPVDQMLEEFDYFADRLRSDADVYPDGAHGLVDMHVMEAIYESAQRREWVVLDDTVN